MVACAYASPATGIVTALSNNATICSVPKFCEANELPTGLSGDGFAALVSDVSERAYPELPTGVGFCLLIKRAVLDRVGLFRQELFGRGYGEENDLCMRARAAGYRVRLSDDVFVFHAGHASFSDETAALCEAHEKILRREHPSYGYEVTRFIETNPLADVHRRINFALARRNASDGNVVLFVLHASPFAAQPGGTELHVRDLLARLAYERAVVVFPEGATLVAMEITGGRIGAAIRYALPIGEPSRWVCTEHAGMEQAFAVLLNMFDVSLVHVHHFGLIPLELPLWLAARSIPLVITAHDYYLACPSFNGFNYTTRSQCACDAASETGCLSALSKVFGDASISREGKASHKRYMRIACDYAHTIVVPSERARNKLSQRLDPDVDRSKLRVVEHGSDRTSAIQQTERINEAPHSTLRIGLLGAISHAIKGADAYLALADRTRHLPVEWHVFGSIPHQSFMQELTTLGREGSVHFEGAYERGSIGSLLHERGIALTLFFPATEETYSYTVTESLLAGIPVVCGPLGAGADRVRAHNAGAVVADIGEAASLLEALTSDRTRLEKWKANALAVKTRTVDEACTETKAIHHAAIGAVEPRPRLLPATRKQLLPYFVDSTRTRPQTGEAFGPWKNSEGRAAQIHIDLARPENKLVDAHVQNRAGRTRIVCKTRDPQVYLALDPIASSTVKCLRFVARVPTRLTLEVFWTHHPDEVFTQEKSAFLTLDATQTPGPFELRFDQPAFSSAWTLEPWIHNLRIDPADCACTIELSDVTLSM
jgi:glycosyltransferase involved in cell wall biosynthesis